jgi:hypothetical protein
VIQNWQACSTSADGRIAVELIAGADLFLPGCYNGPGNCLYQIAESWVNRSNGKREDVLHWFSRGAGKSER